MTTPAPSRCCPCPPPGRAAGLLFCDTAPTGEVTQFIRVFLDDGTVTDVTTEGTPHTVAGTAAPCTGDQADGCDTTTPLAVSNLCLADGTPVGVVVSRDCDGTVSSPGWINLATGVFTEGPAPADTAPCDASVAPCASPTTPITSTGLCLPDGTPIATIASRDCDGVVTQSGWLNLTTGAYTTGLPPTGTIACGAGQSIQVSGVFCDIDPATGDVFALLLIEYHYDDTGAIESVRLVRADDGTTYAPVGTVGICPSSGTQIDTEQQLLCLQAADGTLIQQVIGEYGYDTTTGGRLYSRFTDPTTGAVVAPPVGSVVVACAVTRTEPTVLCDLVAGEDPVPFIRHTVYNSDGTAASTFDTDLGSLPYTPAGVVGLCAPTEPCGDTEQLVLCDTAVLPGSTPAAFTLTENQTVVPGTGFFDVVPVNGGFVQSPTTAGEEQAFWDSAASLTFPAASGPGAGTVPQRNYIIGADLDFTTECGYATGDVTFSADLRNTSLDNPGSAGPDYTIARIIIYNKATGGQHGTVAWRASELPVAGPAVLKSVTASNIPASAFPNLVLVMWTTNWSNFAAQGLHSNSFEATFHGATLNLDGTCSRVQFLRTITRDCAGVQTATTDTELDGVTPYVVVGDVGLCVEPSGSNTRTLVDPGTDAETIQLCDDTGAFLRTFLTDVNGNLTVVRDSDLAGLPYSPVGTVRRCADCPTVLGEVCYSPLLPGAVLSDNWAGSTSTTPPGQRVWTNPDFAGQGIAVTQTVAPDTGAALVANGVTNTAIAPATEHTTINLGALREDVTVRLEFFGAASGEQLRNISPAFDTVTGNGTAVLTNTGVDGGPGADGVIDLTFAGPVQTISWDYSPTGSGLSSQTTITFTELAPGGDTARAARVLGCDGTYSLIDLATGTVLDESTISVVDCPCCPTTTAELVCADGDPAIRRETVDADGAITAEVFTTAGGNVITPTAWTPGRCPDAAAVVAAHHFDVVPGTPWTPANVPPGQTLIGLSVTGLSGTYTVVDADGTSIANLPVGFGESWSATEETATLTPPTSITAAAGSRAVVTMTTR